MMSKREFEKMNCRHQISESCFFGQRDFMRRFQLDLPFGLCAGLVKVWWDELQKGNDAIRSIQMATPTLIGDVLLSQARSFYLKEFPPRGRSLRAAEMELLNFKYGEHGASAIDSLLQVFGVDNSLELDLVLLHNLPILKRWQFSHLASDVVNAVTAWDRPGLYVLLTRFWHSKRRSGEAGHRCALVVEAGGVCRFYDPRWGEMRFGCLEQFARWFVDYWTTERWDFLAQRGSPPPSPVRLFAFGGEFSPFAIEKRLALDKRLSTSGLNLEQPGVWLADLGFLHSIAR
jgi:hypothetical protein